MPETVYMGIPEYFVHYNVPSWKIQQMTEECMLWYLRKFLPRPFVKHYRPPKDMIIGKSRSGEVILEREQYR